MGSRAGTDRHTKIYWSIFGSNRYLVSRRALVPKAGVRKLMPLKLPPDLALDLHAFCEVHFDAPQSRVVCEAVRRFIRAELEEDEITRSRFEAARKRLESSGGVGAKTNESLRLVEMPERSTAREPSDA